MTNVKDNSPRDHKPKKNIEKKGLIVVNTGAGKGKSTAAFGIALRSIGTGYKVAMVQFIKGKWKTGEVEASKKYFSDVFHIFTMGEGFTWNTQNFEQDLVTASKAWEKCKEILNDDQYQVVIFDEINYVLKYNFLKIEDVLEALKNKPEMKHVVLTGGGAPDELTQAADLVTEMKCIKHPYEQGIQAQPGIEF